MRKAKGTSTSRQLGRQAERFYQVFSVLVREYQFRDRERSCSHGVSISQCYTLEMLEADGPMTMSDLAGKLSLDGSTMTRLIDALVSAGLVSRVREERDRRVCCVKITRKGRSLASRIHAQLIREYEEVLREVPAASRDAVVETISRLLAAFRAREGRACSAQAAAGCR